MSNRMEAPERVMPKPLLSGTGLNRPINGPHMRERFREPDDGEDVVAGFIIPPFQRPQVWSRDQQVKLIESIWLGLPIAAYIVAMPQKDVCNHVYGWLIDGQQRWRAIDAYQRGDFPVFGWRYPDLPRIEQRRFEMASFPSIELDLTDQAMLEDIYYRLAYSGVPHT